jgi:hypothetical protein
MDIDSTIQEANIAYPSDAQLMVKMTLLVNKVWTYMKENVSFFADFVPRVAVKAVKATARAYWFRDGKNVDETQRLFQDLWHEAFPQINHVRKYFQILLDYDIDRMPWNIRRAFDQISAHCSDLFLNWQHRPARPLRRGLEPASLSTRVIALLYLLSVLLLGSFFLHTSMTTDSGRPWQSRRPLHIPCYLRLASPEHRRRNVTCAFIVPIHRKAPGTLCGLTGCSRQRKNVPLLGVSCA